MENLLRRIGVKSQCLSQSTIFEISIMVLGIMGLIIFSFVSQDSSGQSLAIPMPQAPQITVNATVISVTLDDEKSCSQKGPSYEYPNDKGIILIREIIKIDNPDDVTVKGYREGDKVRVDFKYSARPAIVAKVPSPSTSSSSVSQETTVTRKPSMQKPVQKKKGYLIFKNELDSIDQLEIIILEGIEVDDKIKATITYSGGGQGSIDVYEIINLRQKPPKEN